jgi:hypothetical protein
MSALIDLIAKCERVISAGRKMDFPDEAFEGPKRGDKYRVRNTSIAEAAGVQIPKRTSEEKLYNLAQDAWDAAMSVKPQYLPPSTFFENDAYLIGFEPTTPEHVPEQLQKREPAGIVLYAAQVRGGTIYTICTAHHLMPRQQPQLNMFEVQAPRDPMHAKNRELERAGKRVLRGDEWLEELRKPIVMPSVPQQEPEYVDGKMRAAGGD